MFWNCDVSGDPCFVPREIYRLSESCVSKRFLYFIFWKVQTWWMWGKGRQSQFDISLGSGGGTCSVAWRRNIFRVEPNNFHFQTSNIFSILHDIIGSVTRMGSIYSESELKETVVCIVVEWIEGGVSSSVANQVNYDNKILELYHVLQMQ